MITAATTTLPEAPLVSVVVHNYNHAPFLHERLGSIAAQTFRDFELIVLDDASTDDSVAVIRELERQIPMRVQLNAKNSGSPYAQWNTGLHLARGRYLWIADSDDRARPDMLGRLVQAMQQHPRVGLAFCRCQVIERDGQERNELMPAGNPQWEHDFVADGRTFCREQLALSSLVATASAVLLRCQVMRQIGGADPSYRLMGDWLVYALMLQHCDLAYVAQPLNEYRRHSGTVRSTTQQSALPREEHRRVVEVIRQHDAALGRAFEVGYHTYWSHLSRIAGDRRQARHHAWQAIRLNWRKPYCWRMLRDSLF
ncbi:MAG: glycosyltransferase family A protein [Phycisphaeraceae bacterium]